MIEARTEDGEEWDRLFALAEEVLGWKQIDVVRATGADPSTISRYVSKKRNPDSHFVRVFAERLYRKSGKKIGYPLAREYPEPEATAEMLREGESSLAKAKQHLDDIHRKAAGDEFRAAVTVLAALHAEVTRNAEGRPGDAPSRLNTKNINSKKVSDVARATRGRAARVAGISPKPSPKLEADAPSVHKREPEGVAGEESK